MIIGLVGNVGGGKSLLETIFLVDDYLAGRKIIANYQINFEHTPFSLDKMLVMNHCSLALDEIHVGLMDSRTPASKVNRLMSYIITQSRKRDCDIYYTAQINGLADLRMRYLANYRILGENIGPDPKNPEAFKYSVFDPIHEEPISRFYMLADEVRPYYDLYDSYKMVGEDELKGMVADIENEKTRRLKRRGG